DKSPTSAWLRREPNRVTTTRQNERDVALAPGELGGKEPDPGRSGPDVAALPLPPAISAARRHIHNSSTVQTAPEQAARFPPPPGTILAPGYRPASLPELPTPW